MESQWVRRPHLRLGLGWSGDWGRNKTYIVVSLFFCGELYTHTHTKE